MDTFSDFLRRLSSDVPTLVVFFQRLFNNKLLKAVPVQVTIPAGMAAITARHGLEYPATGGVITSATAPVVMVPVNLAGVDSSRYVTFTLDHSYEYDIQLSALIF